MTAINDLKVGDSVEILSVKNTSKGCGFDGDALIGKVGFYNGSKFVIDGVNYHRSHFDDWRKVDVAEINDVESIKIRVGYSGKSQQWQYGFDLAIREVNRASMPSIPKDMVLVNYAIPTQLMAANTLLAMRKTKIEKLQKDLESKQAESVDVPDGLIREIFLNNGFTIKEGQTDLKPYVYAAARKLLKTVPVYLAAVEMLESATSLPVQPAAIPDVFQNRVKPWMLECFGAEISADSVERNHRFLEESLELVQSCGCTSSEAHQLVDYVYGRAVGEKAQEVGGVMVTLAALCLAQGIDMHDAGETELARIWTKVDQIRAKQAAKPKHSPLPIPVSDGWVKTVDRLPTREDCDHDGCVWVCRHDGYVSRDHIQRIAQVPDLLTYWMPCVKPQPPVTEKQ